MRGWYIKSKQGVTLTLPTLFESAKRIVSKASDWFRQEGQFWCVSEELHWYVLRFIFFTLCGTTLGCFSQSTNFMCSIKNDSSLSAFWVMWVIFLSSIKIILVVSCSVRFRDWRGKHLPLCFQRFCYLIFATSIDNMVGLLVFWCSATL